MDHEVPSSRRTTWLTGLVPAPPVAETANALRRTLYRESGASAPLPPLLPLGESPGPPPPPVAGNLPKCDSPLIPGRLSHQNGWLIWEIDSGGWFPRLAEALRLDNPWTLFPPAVGIPIAPIPRRDPSPDPEAPGARWRALHLATWEVEIPTEQAWWRRVAWRLIWVRRLRRAPAATREASR